MKTNVNMRKEGKEREGDSKIQERVTVSGEREGGREGGREEGGREGGRDGGRYRTVLYGLTSTSLTTDLHVV